MKKGLEVCNNFENARCKKEDRLFYMFFKMAGKEVDIASKGAEPRTLPALHLQLHLSFLMQRNQTRLIIIYYSTTSSPLASTAAVANYQIAIRKADQPYNSKPTTSATRIIIMCFIYSISFQDALPILVI